MTKSYSHGLSRKDFISTAAFALLGTATGLKAAQAISYANYPIIAFSKPFQELNAKDTADLVSDIGWNGIECPVRPKGQIEPDKVDDLLPQFVETFKARGLSIPIIVTDIMDMRLPYAEKVLRAAARSGIKIIRLGQVKYVANRSIPDQIDEIAKKLKDIGDACAQLGIKAGVENHEGASIFAAPIWDAYTAITKEPTKNIGFCFDIGHATIEGGVSWPIQARLVEPYLLSLYVKDFTWVKGPKAWKPTWCPLGQGMLDKTYVPKLLKSGFKGPLCQHHEYPLGDRKQMIAYMKRDLAVLRQWIA